MAAASLMVAPTAFESCTENVSFGSRLRSPLIGIAIVWMVWPGPKPGLATSTFEPAGGPNFAAEGPWAMFRLIESGQLDRESDSRYLLTLKRGTREVQLRIEADSVRNPFGKTDLQRFRCE